MLLCTRIRIAVKWYQYDVLYQYIYYDVLAKWSCTGFDFGDCLRINWKLSG